MTDDDADRSWADELGGLVEGIHIVFDEPIHEANAKLLEALGVSWSVAEKHQERTWTWEGDDMEAEWYDDATGPAVIEQKRSDAIMALRGAPSFSVTVIHRDRSSEHYAGATDMKEGDAEAFVSLAALRAIQDMAALMGADFEECIGVLRIANQRGL